jgi:hypothetical protein
MPKRSCHVTTIKLILSDSAAGNWKMVTTLSCAGGGWECRRKSTIFMGFPVVGVGVFSWVLILQATVMIAELQVCSCGDTVNVQMNWWPSLGSGSEKCPASSSHLARSPFIHDSIHDDLPQLLLFLNRASQMSSGDPSLELHWSHSPPVLEHTNRITSQSMPPYSPHPLWTVS